MTLKKIWTFFSNETKEVDAVKTWTVRWQSRNGEFHADTQPECEIFPDEGIANEFATSLRLAFKLIRHTSGTKVTVQENK